ncbi:hypothetical protein [Nocardioides zeae]
MRLTTRRGVRRGAALLGSAVLATTVLAGCGDDSDSDNGNDDDSSENAGDDDPFADADGQGVIDAGFAALEDAESFRVAGSVEEDGERAEIDLQLDTEGNCTGSVSAGDDGEFEVLGVDGSYWLRAGADFWTSSTGSAEAAALLADKWVPDEAGDFAEICTVESLLETFDDRELDDAEKGDVVDTDEGEAQEVTGKDDDGDELTVHVLTSDPTYLVGFSSEQYGEVTISEFGEPVETEEPPADEVLDPAALGG